MLKLYTKRQILTITNGTEKKILFKKKMMLQKSKWVIGISGKIEGKLYLPYTEMVKLNKMNQLRKWLKKDGIFQIEFLCFWIKSRRWSTYYFNYKYQGSKGVVKYL